MTNITKNTQFRVIGTENKAPLVYIDEVVEYINAGGGGQATVTVNDIKDATEVGKNVLLATTQALARTTIGAGTSNLTIGTTATTAKAGNYAPPNASTTVNGLMLATDKVKLDGVATGATMNQTDANLLNRVNHTGTQPISTVTGVVPIAQIPTGSTATTVSLGNHTHATATTTVAGFMSGADKTKLDGVASNANNYVLPVATTSVIGGMKVAVGVEDTTGEDLQALTTTLNTLLANLREAGQMY